MDFTYFFAAFIALIIGFFASVVFVLANGHSKLRLIAFALVASLAINGLVLINWSYVGSESVGFLLLDFALIATYGLVGCAMGVLPLLGIRKLWRWHSARVD